MAKSFIAKCNPKKAPPNASSRVFKTFFCSTMWNHMTMEGEPGISAFVLTKLWGENGGDRNLAGVQYWHRARDKPIVFSFCPFCGTNYKAWLKPHLKQAKAKRKKFETDFKNARRRLRETG